MKRLPTPARVTKSAIDMPCFLLGSGDGGPSLRRVKSGMRPAARRERQTAQDGRGNASADAPDGIRVPAAEIESGVIERVRQFLTNGAAVFEALQHLELDVGHAQQLMRRAQEIADTLPNRRRSDLATVLRTLISHIEVQSDQISIALQLGGFSVE